EQGAVPRVVGLGGVDQAGEDRRPVHLLGQSLQLGQGRVQQFGGRTAGNVDLTAVGGLERLGPLARGFEVAADPRVLNAAVEVAQVPRHTVGTAARSNRLDHETTTLAGRPAQLRGRTEGNDVPTAG